MTNESSLPAPVMRPLVRCVTACVDHAAFVIAVATMITALSLGTTVSFLSINTDTAGMIDPELPFRQRFLDLERTFPQEVDTLIAVVDADDPETATQAARLLAASFKRRSDLFSNVYAPNTDPYFETHGLLYLTEQELGQVAGRLQSGIPLLAYLAGDPSLRGLGQFLQFMGYAAQQGKPISDFAPFLDELTRVVEAHAKGAAADFHWNGFLGTGPQDRNGTRKFVIVKPILDFSSLEPAEVVMAEARKMANDPETSFSGAVKIRFTGDVALDAEELRSVFDTVVVAGGIALVLVSIVLTLGVRSWRLVTASLLTLIVGLIWTAGMATLTVGYLNAISVAFAVLFVGLGIDFAIHFSLRYEEEMRRGRALTVALANTASGVGGALGTCAGAAALAFLAFSPTSFIGMSQLGIISAGGMAIAFVTSMTVLPALLALMPLPPPAVTEPRKRRQLWWPFGDWRLAPTVVTLLVAGAGLFFLPQVRFDSDPIGLKDPTTQSVRTFLELFETSTSSPYTIDILANDETESRDLIRRLTALPEVDLVVTIFSFVPEAQERKLPVVQSLRAAMKQVSRRPPAQEIGDEARVQAIKTIDVTLESLSAVPDPIFAKAAKGLGAAIAWYDVVSGARSASNRKLERSMFRGLPRTIDQIDRALSANRVTVASLPAAIRDRYVGRGGRLRLQVLPAENISDQNAMRRFAEAVLREAPQATGIAIQIPAAADMVVGAMLTATGYAGALILIVLFLTIRRIADVMLVSIPVLLAGTLTLAATVWLDIPFNFANVIVLPLLIGLGVAGSVHLVARARAPETDAEFMATNTPRAVLLSALTTIGSFASLGISDHRGLASMGALLTLSLAFILICTLIVLPTLIRWFVRRPA
ncbi:MAG: MMPL family transporter [Hyphomicrobiaceae bacterium]